MVEGDGQLTGEALGLLESLAKRRGWTDMEASAMVVELARDALATYLIVDVSLGDLPMAGEENDGADSRTKSAEQRAKDADLKAKEIMQRTYAELEKTDPYVHMTDEELLNYAGKRLHSRLLELEQREKEGKLPGTPQKGRG
jgi:hypothetical protein